ncbi:MAG: UbiA family prenyltransferase [Candidatus Aenigmatarchaeota archaeon]
MGFLERFLRVYRMKDWIHYLGFVVLGSVFTGNLSLLLFLQASFLLSYAYSLNDYYEGEFARKWFLLPLICSLLLLPFLEPLQVTVSLAFILIFTLYSWPRTYLEGKPGLSTLSNSLAFLLILLLPFTSVVQIYNFRYFLLLIFLLNTAAQLIHEIAHRASDKKNSKLTTAVRLGSYSVWFLRAVLVLVILTSILFIHNQFLVFLSTSLYSAYFLYASFTEIDEVYRKRFKTFGIACGLIYLIQFL